MPAPSVSGSPTVYVLDISSDVGSYTFAHLRPDGAGLEVIFEVRTNSNPSKSFSTVTYGGFAMTIRAQDKQDGANKTAIVVATLDPGVGPSDDSTPANVVVTMSGTGVRDAAGFACNIGDTAGCADGDALASSDAGATSQAISYTASDAGSLIVAMGGCVDATSTVTAGAGMTSIDTQQSANDSAGVEVRLEQRIAGSTDPTSIGVGYGAARAQRAIALAEWLPVADGGGQQMLMAA